MIQLTRSVSVEATSRPGLANTVAWKEVGFLTEDCLTVTQFRNLGSDGKNERNIPQQRASSRELLRRPPRDHYYRP